MIKKFCSLAKIDKEIEDELIAYKADEALIVAMQNAIKRQDGEQVVALATQSQALYGAFYPLLLFSYSLDLVASFFPDEKVLRDTLSDFSIWIANYERDNGKAGLSNWNWLSRHICGKLFRLGRLQVELTTSKYIDSPSILSLHIPQGERLDEGSVDASLALIKKQFPTFDKAYCFSWLLDPALKLCLEKDSNIIKFQNRFKLFPIDNDEGKQTFERVFFTGATKEDVLNYIPKTKLQERVRECVKEGISFSQFGGMINLEK